MWFGMLKVFDYKSATSIIAETVYIGDPDTTAHLLGLWEAAIGFCLVVRPLARIAIALLAVRLPGTLLALALKSDVCWTDGAVRIGGAAVRWVGMPCGEPAAVTVCSWVRGTIRFRLALHVRLRE